MLERQKRFLEAFSEWPTVRSAATKARISRTTHHNWLERDPKYASTFAELEEDLIEEAEAECYRRAKPTRLFSGHMPGVSRCDWRPSVQRVLFRPVPVAVAAGASRGASRSDGAGRSGAR